MGKDILYNGEMEIKFQDDLSNDGNLEDQTESDNFEDNGLVDHQIMDTIQSEEVSKKSPPIENN